MSGGVQGGAEGGPELGAEGGLARRWRAEWEALGRPGAEEEALVALSGGADSTVLLHLLRFETIADVRVSAAHFDHRMRPGSEADARWVRGLCRAWDVPLESGSAAEAPSNEGEARTARYRFLERARRGREAGWILTAHHADDQAETVLHRALRGTGVRGLAGIPRRRGRIVRPLLPFRRHELEEYAERRGIRALLDPTNLELDRPRNVLRHRVLPGVEGAVAPDPAGALVRLARHARSNERGWASVLPDLLKRIVEEESEGRIVLDRPAFLAYHPHVRARLLRALTRRSGLRLSEAGTRAALEFTTSGRSGGRIDLGGGVVLVREFERLVLRSVDGEDGADEALEIREAGKGRGEALAGGRRWRVRWSTEPLPAGGGGAVLEMGRVEYPLQVRAPRPGDRIHLEYGSKKVVRLLAEARVPRSDRLCLPILVDAGGSVLWIPGVRAAPLPPPTETEPTLFIRITDADPD